MPRCNTERAQAIWRSVMNALRGDLSSLVIDTYIEYAKGVDLTSEYFVLCCENTVSRDWIERNQRKNIERLLLEEVGAPVQLRLLSGEEESRAYIAEREKPDVAGVGSEYTFERPSRRGKLRATTRSLSTAAAASARPTCSTP